MRRRPRFVDAAQRIQCGVGCTRTRFVAGSIVEVGACEFTLERVRDALEVALEVRQSLGYLLQRKVLTPTTSLAWRRPDRSNALTLLVEPALETGCLSNTCANF
jgi:hypothetical protein